MSWYNEGAEVPGMNAGYSKQRWQKDYDEYLRRIEQYKGTSFYQELLNNPYYQYQEYDGNIFQQLWSDFTGNTNYIDKFYNDRKTSGDEYFSSVIDRMRQQQYDDPIAQVQRRQNAGLNDALNGGEAIGSGTPGEVTPDDTPPPTPEDNTLNTAVSVASIGFSLFQSGMSMVAFFQDFAGKNLENGLKDITLTGSAYDQAIKMLAGSSSLPGTREEYDSLSEDEKAGLDDQLIQQLDASLSKGNYKNMYSTRAARKLMGVLRGVVSYDKDGKPTLAYETYRSKLLAERYGAHKEAAGVIGTAGFHESLLSFGENIANTFGAIDLHIQQAQERIANAHAASAESRAGYEVEYYGTTVDGVSVATSDAKAAIAGNTATQAAAENQKILEDLRKSVNEEFDALRKIADSKSGLEGVILKLLIPYAHARVMQVISDGLIGTAAGAAGKFLGGKSLNPALQSVPVGATP